MRNGFLLVVVFLIFCRFLNAQQLSFGAAYNYLYSKQWDEVVQYYNSSRPFLAEKLPLLQHGFTAHSDFYFRSNTSVNHGITASYSFAAIGADNSGLNVLVRLHQLQLGYSLKLENCFGWNKTFLAFDAAVIGGKITRLVNDEDFLYADEKHGAFGIGGMIGTQFGYSYSLNDKSRISPFLHAGYSPYYYFPGVEKVINQTQGLIFERRTGLLFLKLGVRYTVHFD
jgi:hypothetical protein